MLEALTILRAARSKAREHVVDEFDVALVLLLTLLASLEIAPCVRIKCRDDIFFGLLLLIKKKKVVVVSGLSPSIYSYDSPASYHSAYQHLS